ncbi:hypothetical protein Dsin_019700 [Dipteronia sinensis]|uniref:X8 domain-containing protein n=1 Tax=Dipteronia sinensis TaxID=43782 RepID=A0AAE0A8J9_9ROSI|nr:hypothetical protein Dsin_019700 [Dipteronia sinensis]
MHATKMANPTLPLRSLSFFLVVWFFISGGFLTMTIAQRTWCVANPMFSSSALIANLDYACSQVDCSSIQQGGSCFYPNTEIHHASFAMNLHYQTLGRHISDCDFRSSGLISLTDPSTGSCTFQSVGDLAEEGAPGRTWCVAKPGTRDDLLQQNINYACNNVDCSPSTDDGGSCYNPTTLINHASFAMNLYYQSMDRNSTSCDFKQTGLIVMTDPSKMREFVSINTYC